MDNSKRYGWYRITTLNGGHGEAVRNCETREEFEYAWKRFGWRTPTPNPALWQGHHCAIGDGVLNVEFKIFARGEHWAHVECQSLASRLHTFKWLRSIGTVERHDGAWRLKHAS